MVAGADHIPGDGTSNKVSDDLMQINKGVLNTVNCCMKAELGNNINDSERRLKFYLEYGFTEHAKVDMDGRIRLLAYRTLGYSASAKCDPHEFIRFEAYLENGWTQDAIESKSTIISHAAQLFMTLKCPSSTINVYTSIIDHSDLSGLAKGDDSHGVIVLHAEKI